MAGDLYLGGGGSADDEAAVWDSMLVASPRILYWPFALPAAMVSSADGWLRGRLAARLEQPDLETWTSLAGHRAAELAAFDLLFVGGGNTFQLLQHVREHDFLQAVQSFVDFGGNYYGGSAGALLATDSIRIADGHDPNEVGLTDLGALGLVHDVDLLPHYTDDQHPSTRRWSVDHQATVLGVPEASGLLVRNGRIAVLGPAAVDLVTPAGTRQFPAGTEIELT